MRDFSSEEKQMKKKSKKENREHKVLLGLIDLYLKTGKPIGSNTLKDAGFEDLSSATIRNYFAELEEQGFLKQPHSSGGRIPTESAFRLYASEVFQDPQAEPEDEEKILPLKYQETKHLTSFLQESTELLSSISGYATFLSSIRFDNDFLQELKLVPIDVQRILCVLVTGFGQIYTETLSCEAKLSSFSIKRIESYFQWRLKGPQEFEKPTNLSDFEELLAKKFYNEVMVRYLVRYSNYTDEDIFRTGLSKLISYSEFSDPLALATGLSLFENTPQMRLLLNDCLRSNNIRYWIGTDLSPYGVGHAACSVLAIPYYVNQLPVGAVGVLGPCRMPYKRLFGILQLFSDAVSEALTKSLYRFKLTFRHPRSPNTIFKTEREIADQPSLKLLESKE